MFKPLKNQNGFSAVETVMVVVIVVLIGAVGFLVYKDQHKTNAATNNAAKSTVAPTNQQKASSNKTAQKFLTISQWGVQAPISGSDTLSVSGQTCIENGDANGDSVNLGCQVSINSQALANSVGSCTAKVGGTVGYFYKLGPNDNYGATNGSGYTPVAQWASQNQGLYSQIGGFYYAFAPIGRATGLSGAAVADSNQMNGYYTGCDSWQKEYSVVEASVEILASKFEAIPQ